MPVDSVDSAGAQHAPRSLDFGYATTAPTARVGGGRGAKLLPADASLADVASYLIFVGTNIDTHALWVCWLWSAASHGHLVPLLRHMSDIYMSDFYT